MSISYWLTWTPPDSQIFEEIPGGEPPKPAEPSFEGFEGALPGVSKKIEPPAPHLSQPDAIPAHDSAEWREPFRQWLEAECTCRPGCFGGVGALHVRFARWEVARGGAHCTRAVFESLLWESGHTVEHGQTEPILREDAAWAELNCNSCALTIPNPSNDVTGCNTAGAEGDIGGSHEISNQSAGLSA
jgi:hypothetical protein